MAPNGTGALTALLRPPSIWSVPELVRLGWLRHRDSYQSSVAANRDLIVRHNRPSIDNNPYARTILGGYAMSSTAWSSGPAEAIKLWALATPSARMIGRVKR
jgi:hypothetical protein